MTDLGYEKLGFAIFERMPWALWYARQDDGSFAYVAERYRDGGVAVAAIADRLPDGSLLWPEPLPLDLAEVARIVSTDRATAGHINHSDLVRTFGGEQ
jgi:hypothetical protein